MLLSQEPGFLRQEVSIEAGVHPECLGLAPDGAHRVLVVEELHVGGGEGEQVRPQGDKPHVQRDAEQRDREEHAQEAEPAQSQRALREQRLQMESHQYKMCFTLEGVLRGAHLILSNSNWSMISINYRVMN